MNKNELKNIEKKRKKLLEEIAKSKAEIVRLFDKTLAHEIEYGYNFDNVTEGLFAGNASQRVESLFIYKLNGWTESSLYDRRLARDIFEEYYLTKFKIFDKNCYVQKGNVMDELIAITKVEQPKNDTLILSFYSTSYYSMVSEETIGDVLRFLVNNCITRLTKKLYIKLNLYNNRYDTLEDYLENEDVIEEIKENKEFIEMLEKIKKSSIVWQKG